MSIRSVGLTAGIFGAASMFFLAWWLIFTGNAEGPITLFERIYIGYSFTPMGSVIGAAWGFVDFGIAGAVFAWLYNCINKRFNVDR
jgi:hypothetical protein|tara:strand:- start:276 stop:533 length:258 start_codon:yes stop_codon:yes gene_type:complete